jgi:hypothetical protein
MAIVMLYQRLTGSSKLPIIRENMGTLPGTNMAEYAALKQQEPAQYQSMSSSPHGGSTKGSWGVSL